MAVSFVYLVHMLMPCTCVERVVPMCLVDLVHSDKNIVEPTPLVDDGSMGSVICIVQFILSSLHSAMSSN